MNRALRNWTPWLLASLLRPYFSRLMTFSITLCCV